MPRFKGITQRVVLNGQDLERLLSMPAAEIDEWSPVKVVILPDTKKLYETFARSIAEEIKRNNSRGEETKMIVPVGPTPQYPMLAEITNRERISWKKVWTFNMDEYLDWQGRPVPEGNSMSFKGYMKKNLFGLIDKELRIQRNRHGFQIHTNRIRWRRRSRNWAE